MKILRIKLSLMALLFTFFSSQLNARNTIDVNFVEFGTADPVEVDYDDLPPFVKEFLYKAYEVKPEDVRKIVRVQQGSYVVTLNRSVNVFGINTKLKMQNEKLDYFETKPAISPNKMRSRKVEKTKLTRQISMSSNETEIAWASIPRNVREYLIKRMYADEDQVYKAFDLGNSEYKIILKKAHNKFVIFEDSPDKIAFDHFVMD